MKLIECYIENFGKLKNERISFSEGLNSIKRDNGWGKTTLSVFIKVMLFGMSDTKKANLEENDRRHYLPWDGSAARGTLTFEAGGKAYRIERGFAPKAADDTFTLYDLSTGRVTEDFSERLGEELFGIDADGFERTVFLSERALTPKSENKSVSAKLSDLVGCDGDIGVMDEAMKRLEEERKFYYKKGGSGELSNIKSSISDIERRLIHLNEVEALADTAEKRAKELKAELSALSERRLALAKEREGLAHAEARANIEKRYSELNEEIKRLSEKRASLLEFFGGTAPTHTEISNANQKLSEASSLEKSSASEADNPEYKSLCGFFGDKTDEGEISALRGAIFEAKSRIIARKTTEIKNPAARFTKRIPSHAEVDALIAKAHTQGKATERKLKKPLLIVGVAFAASGICLGLALHFALLALSLIGLLLIAAAFVGKKTQPDTGEDLRDFYASIGDSPAPEGAAILADLYEIKAKIDQAEEQKRLTEPCEAENIISNFCKKFSAEIIADDISFAESAISKFDRMTALSTTEKYRQEEAKNKRERAEILRGEANDFIAKFGVVSSDPISEILEKLKEFDRVSADLALREKDAERYSDECEKGALKEVTARSEEEISRDTRDVEDGIASKEREYAVTDRKRQEFLLELEGRDELEIKLSELRETLDLHTENYNVILKTKEYLERAKDSMTAKYLGKTKAGFEKYASLIGGDDGRFEMSCDFGVSKFEGAAPKGTEAYSRGTKDLYNLSARLGLIDALYEGEAPFIILDDPFASFDDKKTESALKLLSRLSETKQIIYFTCASSRDV